MSLTGGDENDIFVSLWTSSPQKNPHNPSPTMRRKKKITQILTEGHSAKYPHSTPQNSPGHQTQGESEK